MDQKLQDIFDKAHKLKNLADRAGTPEEAAVAATKLQELLLRHNIEMQSLDDTTPKDEYIQEDFLINENRNHKTWAFNLYFNIAQAHQCEALVEHYKKGSIPKMLIVGRRHNIQIVNYLYDYLSSEIKRLADTASTRTILQGERASYKRAFCVGAGIVVSKRVRTMFEKIKTESFQNNAIMVVEDFKVKAKFKELYPHQRKGAKTSITSYNGLLAGKKAGESISLNRGISGKSTNQLN